MPPVTPNTPAMPSSTGQDEPHTALASEAVVLAAQLLRDIRHLEPGKEKRRLHRLGNLHRNPGDKAFFLALIDRVFRARTSDRTVRTLRAMCASHGLPRHTPLRQRLLIGFCLRFAKALPEALVMTLLRQLQRDFSRAVMPDAPERLHAELAARRKAGMRVSVAIPGGRAISREEAQARMEQTLVLLADPTVPFISVCLSSLLPPLDDLAFDAAFAAGREVLRQLYRAAMACPAAEPDGVPRPKLVQLDLEDSRETEGTTEVFLRTLEEPEFSTLEAGLTLLACLPDAHATLCKLTTWALARKESGGAPIRIRIAKGGNLAGERLEAGLRGWKPTALPTKLEVDAMFKAMLHHAFLPRHAAAVHIGVATQNLFDIAYALLLRDEQGVADEVEFECLDAGPSAMAVAIKNRAGAMRLHAHVAASADFSQAIPVFLRDLEAWTADGSFLRDLWELSPGTSVWESHRQRFLRSCQEIGRVRATAASTTSRTSLEGLSPRCPPDQAFENEPDTDWSIPANRSWIRACLDAHTSTGHGQIPLVVAGETVLSGPVAAGHDPARPTDTSYSFTQADDTQIVRATRAAAEARRKWAGLPQGDRRAILIRAAAILAGHRGETIATLVHDAGLPVPVADNEVSRAVDFANHHARAMDTPEAFKDVAPEPMGTVVVASSADAPYATPCGNILAALMVGNTVIFRPAQETVLAGWHLANQLWKSGLPRDVLQFLPVPDNHLDRALLLSPQTDAVIYSGDYEGARFLQSLKPNLRLHAQIRGKNSAILTAAADETDALRDLARMAFSCAGQREESVSVAILTAELHDSPGFLQRLVAAAASLPCGPAASPVAVVTPMIRPAAKDLQRALLQLDPGEIWLRQPRQCAPGLWSPGIRAGLNPDSWLCRSLVPGPVLAIVRAADLADAIRIQNSLSSGFSGCLYSLDPGEIAAWKAGTELANACVNCPTRPAIPGRHPMGSWRNAVFGTGAKPGGPNSVPCMAYWRQQDIPDIAATLRPEVNDVLQTMKRWLKEDLERKVADAAARSFQHFMETEFSIEHGGGPRGESNVFRYQPLPRGVLLRLREPIEPLYLAGVVLGAMTTRVPVSLSLQRPSAFADVLGIPVIVETEDELARRLAADAARHDHLRTPQGTVAEVLSAAAASHLAVIDQPILANGRLELLHYFRAQTITECTHRHGIPI